MTGMYKSKGYKGWTIRFPTHATKMHYCIEHVNKPGFARLADTLSEAMRWIDAQPAEPY